MVNKKAVNVQGKSLQHFQRAQRTAAQDYFENIIGRSGSFLANL